MKNKIKYALAVGDYSYSFTTDPQLVPMTWVERYDTLAEACAEINDIYKYRAKDRSGECDFDLTIIEESEIDHDLGRSICGDDYREEAPNYEQLHPCGSIIMKTLSLNQVASSKLLEWTYGDYSGTIKTYEDERHDPLIEWDNEAPENYEEIEEMILANYPTNQA